MLIELFKVLFLVFSTVAWRMMPNDLPPWYTVYQQTQRWLMAGVFEAMVHDLRALLRLAAGRELSNHRQRFSMAERCNRPRRAVSGLVTMAINAKRAAKAKKGFVLLPKHWVVERSFAWAARFRRLARDYERLPETLAGLHFLAFAMVMLK